MVSTDSLLVLALFLTFLTSSACFAFCFSNDIVSTDEIRTHANRWLIEGMLGIDLGIYARLIFKMTVLFSPALDYLVPIEGY